METLKYKCFRYRNSADIYFSNIFFSSKSVERILTSFLSQNVIAIIDAENDMTSALPMIEKYAIKKNIFTSNYFLPIYSVGLYMDKEDFIDLFDYLFDYHIDGLFIANLNTLANPEELLPIIKSRANSLVKKGLANTALSFNFPENELVISVIDKTNLTQYIETIRNTGDGLLNQGTVL